MRNTGCFDLFVRPRRGRNKSLLQPEHQIDRVFRPALRSNGLYPPRQCQYAGLQPGYIDPELLGGGLKKLSELLPTEKKQRHARQ